MSNFVYRDVPYTFHSVNVEDAKAVRACLDLASLFTDSPLPVKAVPFMQKLGSPLMVEGSSYRLEGIRLEVGKGSLGYQLLLKKRHDEDTATYRMALPRYPLLTRLHADGESICPLAMVSGAPGALIHLLEVIEGVHVGRGRRMGPACLEISKLLQKCAVKGFKETLSISLTQDSLVLSTGPDAETEETVYAAPMVRMPVAVA